MFVSEAMDFFVLYVRLLKGNSINFKSTLGIGWGDKINKKINKSEGADLERSELTRAL